MSAVARPQSITERVSEALKPAINGQLSPSEILGIYKGVLQSEEGRIKQLHRDGAGGLEITTLRSELIDTVIRSIHAAAVKGHGGKLPPFAILATGGYGRGVLNPGSDIDLLFLLPKASTNLPPALREIIQGILYPLWDVGFKVGHASRSIAECIEQAQLDQENKTSLMDARLIVGDADLHSAFEARFEKHCIQRGQQAFFELRRKDLWDRHSRHSHTVFLQEPHVKEGCGGLRDFHNIFWVARVKRGIRNLDDLVEQRLITSDTRRELEEAHDFLLRVRNELHYHSGRAIDQLTLHLQGVVCTALQYPQRSILRRTEAFMRDYYRHTRHIHRHSTSIMEAFEIEAQAAASSGIRSFLTFRSRNRETFDGFIARDGFIHPENPLVFRDDPNRLMRLFQHCQLRGLRLSPEMRRLVAAHWDDIDRPFRYSKANRETFEAILERKGQAAAALRQMHRIGFLGRYIPEFGALDCLVQHEFFHRYTADEHTLRVADITDALLENENPSVAIYRRLLVELQDPYAFHLAILLHDAGRAENVREHTDGSAILASRLCNRLQIRGARRSFVTFLVDNHLVFWRTATTRNLDDPEVIAEFAAIVKTRVNLDALFLFSYADSNATSTESWNSWKESLMIQLHTATTRFLENGRAKYEAMLADDRDNLRNEVFGLMAEDYHPHIRVHFELMPPSAFHFRPASHVVTQVRTVRHFLNREAETGDAYATCVKWIDQPEKGYTSLVLASRDKPHLLEKICCALASQEINILSADFYTRADGVVMNIFRVCTTNFEPVSSTGTRQRFLETFEKILHFESYNPADYLRRKTNYLRKRTDSGIPVPVRARVGNDLHPNATTVEIQALDRIGLLHDLLSAINRHGLNTAHARICTEKGVAMDTLYITTRDGSMIEDATVMQALENDLDAVIRRSDEDA
ncbi:MAG: [protein-PII] uridylyltransferase [Luteolibacter sp.]